MASVELRKSKFPLLPGHTGAATPAPLVSPSEMVPQESKNHNFPPFNALVKIALDEQVISDQLGWKLSKIAPPQWVCKNQCRSIEI